MILGKDAEKLKAQIGNLPVEIILNKNWKAGISSSIKAGLSAFPENGFDAAVIMLCDQPFVSPELLRRLADGFRREKSLIAACKYQNTIGVPALFSAEMFSELLYLERDEGAKKIIKKHIEKTFFIEAQEAAFDIDTFQDYEKLSVID